MHEAGVEFVLKDIARATTAGAEGVASLQDKVVIEAVKAEAVLVRLADLQAAGLWIDPIALAGGEPDEIGDGSRGEGVVQLHPEGAELGFALRYGDVGVNLCVGTGGEGKQECH